jgi:hypothetical protein
MLVERPMLTQGSMPAGRANDLPIERPMPTGRVDADQEDWSMPAGRADDFPTERVDAGRQADADSRVDAGRKGR